MNWGHGGHILNNLHLYSRRFFPSHNGDQNFILEMFQPSYACMPALKSRHLLNPTPHNLGCKGRVFIPFGLRCHGGEVHNELVRFGFRFTASAVSHGSFAGAGEAGLFKDTA